MAETAIQTRPVALQDATESVVAVYRHHDAAEEAVRLLAKGGVPINKISIIGRDFQLREDIQGFYRPSDLVKEGAGFGAWVGGLFGTLLGFGLFMIPVAGPLIVLGPLGGLIAGAISGAGVGALIGGLMALGMDRDQALKYQARLQAGDFLVTVAGTHEEVERARQILHDSGQTEVEQFQMRETA